MKKIIGIGFFCCCFLCFNSINVGQVIPGNVNREFDSLLRVLTAMESDTLKEQASNDTLKINLRNRITRGYIETGNYDTALNHAEIALKMSVQKKYLKGIAAAYNNLGCVNIILGNYSEALPYLFKSLKISEAHGFKKVASDSYTFMGTLYWKQENYNMALNNYFKALKLGREMDDKQLMAACLINAGNLYSETSEYDKASGMFNDALVILQELLKTTGNKRYKKGIAAAYNNIGQVNYMKKDYENALANFQKAFILKQEIGDKLPLASSYNNIGKVYMQMGKQEDAYEYLVHGLNVYKELGVRFGVQDSYDILSEFFEKKGDFKKALEYHKMYSDIKDSLLNETSTKQIAEMNTKYESEKQKKNIQLLTKDTELQLSEIARQKLIRNVFIVGLILLLILTFTLFNRFQITNKQKKIIELKNEETEKQKIVIEQKNIDITDSIDYARLIQHTILPHRKAIWDAFPDSFVLFKPKDIVSGDFYFFSVAERKKFQDSIEEKNKVERSYFLAAADCTGHGVPGALMSMLSMEKLNSAALSETSPAQILKRVNNGIKMSLRQSEMGKSMRDGMDIALLRVDFFESAFNAATVYYAGANRPLWIIRNGNSKVEEVKPTKKSIGGHTNEDQDFAENEIEVFKGDTLYIFSDGFADLFSRNGEKLMTSRFKETLLRIQDKTMKEQGKYLDEFAADWRGEQEQIDDILVIGIRF